MIASTQIFGNEITKSNHHYIHDLKFPSIHQRFHQYFNISIGSMLIREVNCCFPLKCIDNHQIQIKKRTI